MGQLPTQVAHTRHSAMRTSRRTIIAFVLGALPLAPAFGFDGTPVNDIHTFKEVLGRYQPNMKMEMTVQRGNKMQTVTLTLEKPKTKAPKK